MTKVVEAAAFATDLRVAAQAAQAEAHELEADVQALQDAEAALDSDPRPYGEKRRDLLEVQRALDHNTRHAAAARAEADALAEAASRADVEALTGLVEVAGSLSGKRGESFEHTLAEALSEPAATRRLRDLVFGDEARLQVGRIERRGDREVARAGTLAQTVAAGRAALSRNMDAHALRYGTLNRADGAMKLLREKADAGQASARERRLLARLEADKGRRDAERKGYLTKDIKDGRALLGRMERLAKRLKGLARWLLEQEIQELEEQVRRLELALALLRRPPVAVPALLSRVGLRGKSPEGAMAPTTKFVRRPRPDEVDLPIGPLRRWFDAEFLPVGDDAGGTGSARPSAATSSGHRAGSAGASEPTLSPPELPSDGGLPCPASCCPVCPAGTVCRCTRKDVPVRRPGAPDAPGGDGGGGGSGADADGDEDHYGKKEPGGSGGGIAAPPTHPPGGSVVTPPATPLPTAGQGPPPTDPSGGPGATLTEEEREELDRQEQHGVMLESRDVVEGLRAGVSQRNAWKLAVALKRLGLELASLQRQVSHAVDRIPVLNERLQRLIDAGEEDTDAADRLRDELDGTVSFLASAARKAEHLLREIDAATSRHRDWSFAAGHDQRQADRDLAYRRAGVLRLVLGTAADLVLGAIEGILGVDIPLGPLAVDGTARAAGRGLATAAGVVTTGAALLARPKALKALATFATRMAAAQGVSVAVDAATQAGILPDTAFAEQLRMAARLLGRRPRAPVALNARKPRPGSKPAKKPAPAGDRAVREPLGGGAAGGSGGRRSTQEVLNPGGKPIGTRGSKKSIRQIDGGPQEVQRTFDELARGGTPSPRPDYAGTSIQLPDGGWAGLRVSDEFGLTIDLDVPGVPFRKIHSK